MRGGYLSIIAEQYEYRGEIYSNLAYHSEPSRSNGQLLSRRSGGRGGGPSLTTNESGVVEMDVSHGCVGRYAYTLAYGVLRNPVNVVTARTKGKTTEFRKVVIPAQFHSPGVLVYALLGPGHIQLTTRTPGGHILHKERYPEERAVCRR